MWEKVRGFADTTSIDFGESFVLRVSTAAPTWRVDAYRIGYYGGGGGRLIWSSPEQPGKAQSYGAVDQATNMREARWDPSLEVQTDGTWPPGQYLLKLVSSDGGASFVPLVIRDDESPAPLLMQSAVTTWQAYNPWGNANLYTGANGTSATRSRVVSFDRPYGGNGSGEFLGREFEFIWFLERLGYDVTYWTDIDLDAQGDRAQQHQAVIIPGHDEYYTVEMRAALERARDAGVNLAFFGANNIYRRIRLEPSPLGERRREVNYRSAAEDPLNGKDDEQVTTSFREAPRANPESSLIGNYYECNPVKADWVVGDASAWMFAELRFPERRSRDRHGRQRVRPGDTGRPHPREHPGHRPLPRQLPRHVVVRQLHLVLGAERRRRVLRRHLRLEPPDGRGLPSGRGDQPAVPTPEGHGEPPRRLRRRTGRRRAPERQQPLDVRHRQGDQRLVHHLRDQSADHRRPRLTLPACASATRAK